MESIGLGNCLTNSSTLFLPALYMKDMVCRFLSIFGLALCITLTGCIDITQKVILNPDGSGKTEFNLYVITRPVPPTDLAGIPNPTQELSVVVAYLLKQSTDFEAWKDIQCDRTKDGRCHILGVAYFKDFNHRKMYLGEMEWEPLERWSAHQEGGMQLTVELFDQQKKVKEKAEERPLNNTEIDARVAEAIKVWKEWRGIWTEGLGTMSDDTSVMLPGKAIDTGVFEPVQGGVRRVLEGSKLVFAMDQMAADEGATRAAIKAGRDPFEAAMLDDKSNRMIFGRSGNRSARVSGEMKAQFDYQVEVAAAKAAMPSMIKKLGLNVVPGLNRRGD